MLERLRVSLLIFLVALFSLLGFTGLVVAGAGYSHSNAMAGVGIAAAALGYSTAMLLDSLL